MEEALKLRPSVDSPSADSASGDSPSGDSPPAPAVTSDFRTEASEKLKSLYNVRSYDVKQS